MSTKTLLTGTAVGGALVLATAVATTALSARTLNEPLQASQGCYVPTSGTVYVIGVPGAPTTCRTGHTPITLQGPAGPAGPQGPAGPAGAFTAFPAFTVVTSSIRTVNPGQEGGNTATCPVGMQVINGGYRFETSSPEPVELVESRPANFTTGTGPRDWIVVINNPSSQARTMRAYALCVPVQP